MVTGSLVGCRFEGGGNRPKQFEPLPNPLLNRNCCGRVTLLAEFYPSFTLSRTVSSKGGTARVGSSQSRGCKGKRGQSHGEHPAVQTPKCETWGQEEGNRIMHRVFALRESLMITLDYTHTRNGEHAGHIFIFPFLFFCFPSIAIDIRLFLFTTAIHSWSVKLRLYRRYRFASSAFKTVPCFCACLDNCAFAPVKPHSGQIWERRTLTRLLTVFQARSAKCLSLRICGRPAKLGIVIKRRGYCAPHLQPVCNLAACNDARRVTKPDDNSDEDEDDDDYDAA
ncbi:hypothetical protein ALC60_03753 [Trachymyrmex zeteki]|uniref:Uncharacterized protein n=1 Tax=Mycetomoellerius zeteki TaxID=64791 RepID=A0A151XA15_9HYME|nr:hypothetical protein ALC60_03753 [Trachymyrmex zeteki]